MKTRLIYIILMFVCLLSEGFSENIEQLVNQYNQNNALSNKTIDANRGHLVLFTRDDLESMQAKRLRDVFKSMPFMYYHENRYNLPDPFTSGGYEPYRSSFIRIYIDGVEITQGWAGSGLVIYGDINLDFIDHIEFYYSLPSFENSSESSYMNIFLYTKNSCRDNGSNINLTYGSRGYNSQTFSYADTKDGVSYMFNFAHTDAKRAKIDNGTDTPLNRNFDETLLFGYIKTDKHTFHIQYINKDTHSLTGGSLDATPIKDEIDYETIHLDYSFKFNNYWKMIASYDRMRVDFDLLDDNILMISNQKNKTSFDGYSIHNTYSAELIYKRNFDKYLFTAGLKGRIKKVVKLSRYDMDQKVEMPFDQETLSSAFMQDQYILSDDSLLSAGIEFVHIDRNGGVDDDDFIISRLGYIYTKNLFEYKAYLFKTQFALEPSTRVVLCKGDYKTIKPQSTYGFTQEFAYHMSKKHDLRLLLLYFTDKDSLMNINVNRENREKVNYYMASFDYKYNINLYNKIYFNMYYAKYTNIYGIDELKDHSGYIKIFNKIGRFNVYNEFTYRSNNLDDWKSYIDWTSAVSIDINPRMSLSFKGVNILDKAKASPILRYDVSGGVPKMMSPLMISPIDRQFLISLEYSF